MLRCLSNTLSDGSKAVYAWWLAMHTRVDVFLKGMDESNLRDICHDIEDLVAAVESEGSCFDEGSPLARFNRLQPGEDMDGGRFLYDMLQSCCHYHDATDGVFDVTVESPGHYPGMMKGITFLPEHRISKSDSGLRVNLSGFIKGYALDRIKELLEEQGISDAVVSLGNSSILSMGDNPSGVAPGCITVTGNPPGRPFQIIDPRNGRKVTCEGKVMVETAGGVEGEVAATVRFVREGSAMPSGQRDVEVEYTRNVL